MEPLLDESSLIPCDTTPTGNRIRQLATVLQALDRLGLPGVLRSVRNAADRDIGMGLGLRKWCFDRATDRDAGRLVARRLDKPPYIDGDNGLFAATQGTRAIEATVDGQPVFALALAAINDELAVGLGRAARPRGSRLTVEVSTLDDEGVTAQSVEALYLITKADVDTERSTIEALLDRSITNGPSLLQRAGELFPTLRFGSRAENQIRDLIGSEVVFRQLIRHLRALDVGAKTWGDGPFTPGNALTWSDESNSTLEHRKYGPMRDFPVPDGFQPARWRFHTKFSGPGFRLYFRGDRGAKGPVVLIGYFGEHLPTVKYPT